MRVCVFQRNRSYSEANGGTHVYRFPIEVALVTTFTISSPIPNTERHMHSVARHRAIADAIRDRDVAAAKEAMRGVIQDGAERVLAASGPD